MSAERGVLAALALAEAGRALNQSRSPAPERLSLSLCFSLPFFTEKMEKKRNKSKEVEERRPTDGVETKQHIAGRDFV